MKEKEPSLKKIYFTRLTAYNEINPAMYVTALYCFEPMFVSKGVLDCMVAGMPPKREVKSLAADTHLRVQVQKHARRTA